MLAEYGWIIAGQSAVDPGDQNCHEVPSPVAALHNIVH
jgi:hypothetical protein